MSGKEELKYVQELSIGNHKAFDYLFLQYYPKVSYFIQHLVKSSEIAKDLSQDIFEKLWINREHVAQIESFSSYIFRMAKNSALNYLDHLHVRSEYENNLQYNDIKLSIEEEIDTRDLELLILLVVENMPPQRKKIFKLSREQYLKNKEIADLLNISEKTVKNHLTLALKELRESILIILPIFLYFN